ncbi:GGDEF domain-containing protein [Candidatus Stoquefichus sp. SB1]|uniref:GGDEF domain-containing protein n=1 Tax=Candidatus Stoquefichus sp. SB1 TaxID=1658109 RepID=UPI00067E8398|nr:GGDEF domain-containing protein [Candidatus Stoquefichus sp. SB1]
MSYICNLIDYHFKEKAMLKDNAQEIEKLNQRMLYRTLLVAVMCFIVLFTLSLFVESYKDYHEIYIVLILTMSCFDLFVHKVNFQIPSIYFLYFAYTIAVSYATYSSAIMAPDYISVFILACLFAMPIIGIDASWRACFVEIFLGIFYLLIVFYYKVGGLFADELINVCMFTFLGLSFGSSLRKIRIENLEMRRLDMIRENIDSLTQTLSRRKLFTDLSEYKDLDKLNQLIGIIMIDIDNFKIFNDTYGHVAGDKCLREIGKCFNQIGLINDMKFYRYGGEEFVGLMYHGTKNEMITLCEQINHAIFDLKIPNEQIDYHYVTISAGLILVDERYASLPYDKWITQADIALYKAKSEGRNRVVVYQDGMMMGDKIKV